MRRRCCSSRGTSAGLTGAVILGVVATLLGIVSVYWMAGVIVLAATATLLVAAARGVLAMTAAD